MINNNIKMLAIRWSKQNGVIDSADSIIFTEHALRTTFEWHSYDNGALGCLAA